MRKLIQEKSNTDKVKDLAELIFEECRQQDFTVAEVDRLQTMIYLEIDKRRQKTEKELF